MQAPASDQLLSKRLRRGGCRRRGKSVGKAGGHQRAFTLKRVARRVEMVVLNSPTEDIW